MTDSLSEKQERKESLFLPQSPETRIIDAEVLLQEAFSTDPREGCSLLFRLYYAPLCSHAVRFVYSKQVAEDLVAEVFCGFWDDRIFQKINTSYRAYLFKCVRNSAYNYVRRKFARRLDAEKVIPDHSSADPSEVLQYDELYHLLDETINQLPQQCKKVFLLSRMEKKSYHEMAAELNISVKAVEAHISRALRILRKKLDDDWNWK